MIRLDTTSRKLTAVLDGGTNGVHYAVTYNDRTATAFGPGATAVALSNGTTPVDILAAPSGSTVREVDGVTARNTSGAARTVTIKYDVSGTGYEVAKATLAAGGALQYTHGEGWRAFDADGALAGGGGGSGGGTGAALSVYGVAGGSSAARADIAVLDTASANMLAYADGEVYWLAASGPGVIYTDGSLWSTGILPISYGGTGAALADPGADRVMFWDDSAGAVTWLTVGSGLSITGTTLTSIGGPLDINGLSSAVPALGDASPIYDVSAAANRKVTLDTLVGLQPATPGGRLSLSSTAPVADVSPASYVYYIPFVNDRITLWDGSQWVTVTFTSPSCSVPMGSGVFDVFAYISAGLVALETSAWSTAIARTTDVTIQDGRYCKSGNKSRLYLGTFYTPSGLSTDDGPTKRFVWNMYNRVQRALRVTESTDSWTYTTATWRAANGSGTNRVEFVRGLDLDSMGTEVHCTVAHTSSITLAVGVGLDSTSTNSAHVFGAQVNNNGSVRATYRGLPGIGYHYFQWLEFSQASGTTTWFGDGGVNYVQSGLTAEGWF